MTAHAPSPRIVLGIDTATPAGGVALGIEGILRVRPIEWRTSFQAVSPAVEGLLAEAELALADLEAVAVPSGPGSFTGLRVGAAMALGLCRISGCPLHGVPTLAAVAEAHAPADALRVCASLDARRGRRYAALYGRDGPGLWRLLGGPVDGTPEQVRRLAGDAPPATPDGSAEKGAIAAALVRIATADPGTALRVPGELRLVYARPGVDPV